MPCGYPRVGLSTVLVLLTLVLVLTAVLVTALLTSIVAEAALSDSERTALDGLEACFATGRSAAEEIADDVLLGALEHAGTRIDAFLAPARGTVLTLRRFLLGIPYELHDNAYYRNTTIRMAVLSAWDAARENSLAVQAITYSHLHLFDMRIQHLGFMELPWTIGRPRDEFHMKVAVNSDTLMAVDERMGSYNASGHIIPGPCDMQAALRTEGRQATGICRRLSGAADEGSRDVQDFYVERTGLSWTGPTLDVRLSAVWGLAVDNPVYINLITSFIHPGKPLIPVWGQKAGVVFVRVGVKPMSHFLREIAASAAPRARMYVTQTDPKTNLSGYLIGMSHGELVSSQEAAVANAMHAQDPVVRSHARMAMLADSSLGALPTEAVMTTVRDRYFCGNAAGERLELGTVDSVDECANSVFMSATQQKCSLTFYTLRHVSKGTALHCACVAYSYTCTPWDTQSNVYRATPAGGQLLHPDKDCEPGALRLIFTAPILAGLVDGCYEQSYADPLCSDAYMTKTEPDRFTCYCVAAGKTCDPRTAHEWGSNTAIFEWQNISMGQPADVDATYGRLEGFLHNITIANETRGTDEVWWARVLRLSDGMGLLMHISGLVPLEDVLASATHSFNAVKYQIEVNTEQTREEQDRAYAINFVIVACVTAALLIAAAAFPRVVIAPLRSLEVNMALVAQMRTEEVQSGTLSHLMEVRRMQESFFAMLDCINTYKSFLPQSILQGGVDEGGQSDDQCVIPQLAADGLRKAVQCAVSQAVTQPGCDVTGFMAGRLTACLEAGDVGSALLLCDCGWDPPADLRAKLPAQAGEQQTTSQHIQSTEARSLLRQRGTAARRHTMDSCATSAIDADNAQHPSRFSDGADSPGSAIAAVSIFPVGYTPPPIMTAVLAMSDWHHLTGATYWSSDDIANVVADYNTCHGDSADQEKIVLYIYSIEMNQRHTWTVWLGHRWCLYPDQDAKARTDHFKTVVIDDTDLGTVGLDAMRGCGQAVLRLESACGLRVYEVQGRPFLLRYENVQGGDAELSPLKDTVVWAPHPDELVAPRSPLSLVSHTSPPPPGVYEYVTSRDFRTNIQKQCWASVPVVVPGLTTLRDACMAKKNQQKFDAALAREGKVAFAPTSDVLEEIGPEADDMAAAFPSLYAFKCPETPGETPTPAKIAHATELGALRWHGHWMLTALTGAPRCVAPLSAHAPGSHGVGEPRLGVHPQQHPRDDAASATYAPGVCQLWRSSRATAGQPYYLMNYSIRMQQEGKRDATLEVPSHPSDRFSAAQPSVPPAWPAPAEFLPTRKETQFRAARWVDGAWNLFSRQGDPSVVPDAIVTMLAWGLPQYRPLIWHLDNVLRRLPLESPKGKARKGYRGLAGVQLDTAVYARGKIVVFGAFTSTSGDQGVATGFAMSEAGAAIFTVFGRTGRDISRWSRFGREKEVLFPPNTLHIVTEALSAEHAAILDKSNLQVFDLTETTMAEAMHKLAKEGALEICREYPDMLGRVDTARCRAEDGDWLGAVQELLAEPRNLGNERRFQLAVRPTPAVGVVALVLDCPSGQEVGAGISSSLWSEFFQWAETVAKERGARLMSTHFGSLMLQVSATSIDAAAKTAVTIAAMLLDNNPVAPASPVTPAGATPDIEVPFAGAGFFPSSPRVGVGGARAGGPLAASGFQGLSVHCGVAAGTVHSGFAGSSAQRVEIADGPAVRRARTLAGYACRFGISETVTDASCRQAIGAVGVSSCIADLVTFSWRSDIREPIYVTCCAGGLPSGVLFPDDGAQRIQIALPPSLPPSAPTARSRPCKKLQAGLTATTTRPHSHSESRTVPRGEGACFGA